MPFGIVTKRKETLVLCNLEHLLVVGYRQAWNQYLVLFYRVLCAKNYRFCFKAACSKSKVDTWRSNKTVMFVVLNIFYMRPWFLFKGLLFHTSGTILPN